MSELHVLKDLDSYRRILGVVKGRRVVEYGVGTGALTKLLLEAGAEWVYGYEIVPGICEAVDPRFTLQNADYTRYAWNAHLGTCVVANPAYSTLPYLIENVLPCVFDAILMVPPSYLEQMRAMGFALAFTLEGDAFEPVAKGLHHVMIRGFGEAVRFTDLHREVLRLGTSKIKDRVAELSAILPNVSLCAIGGFPVRQQDDRFYWCDTRLTVERLRENLMEALGLSAVMTYTNKNRRSLYDLGEICTGRDETWAYHWVTLTLVISGFSPQVQLSFARDTRFKLGWAVTKEFSPSTLEVFTATATLKDWLKYTAKHSDGSFDLPTRAAMLRANMLLKGLLP